MRKIWCSRCGDAYAVAEVTTATRVQCPVCGHIQPIPEPGEYALEGSPRPEATEPPGGPPSPPPQPRKPAASAPGTSGPLRVRDHLRASARERSRIEGLTLVLVGLSAADVFMTYLLLRTGPQFYEGNPIARLFFERWNMAGMVLFKFGVIGGVVALGEIIERHRPRWGKAVLVLGCAGAAYAIAHGLRLYLGHA